MTPYSNKEEKVKSQIDFLLMADFAERLLFGGAIKCKVPPNFADISVIRTVLSLQLCF